MPLKIKPIKASVNSLAIACAFFLVLADNHFFWTTLFRLIHINTGGGIFFAITSFIILAGTIYAFILLFGFKYVLKPFLITIFVISALISYFMTKYGTIIDRSMIQNIVSTDYKEAKELLTLSLAWHVAVFGLLPAAAVGAVQVQFRPFMRELSARALSILIVLAAIGASVMINYKGFALIGREHKELRLSINPGYALYSAYKYVKNTGNHAPVQPLGLDARRREPAPRKKTLVILVIGETARAREFSLNGYNRMTNPYLARDGVVSFTRAYSSGTSTAESLPCMFSHLGNGNCSPSEALRYQNVLDVLSHAGVTVLWRDNNSGCKGICSRVTTENMANLSLPDICNKEECFDEVLLSNLQEYVDRTDSDTLIVLHQKGSHGPAYYKRRPDRFRVFTPECTDDAPQNCSTEEIVNAYDNTILYTDYFLHRTIEFLRKNARKYDTMMVYFSDHGESLGEEHVFLHGLPYFIAPDEQKHVPFIVWVSPGYASDSGLNTQRLAAHRDEPYSHGNIFHSLLGAFHVSTDVYEETHDIFQPSGS